MSRFVRAGAKVFRRARTSPRGQGMSYPAGRVVLLEDARIGPDAGWDVVDVRLVENGEESGAYSFDLSRAQPAPETTALIKARHASEHANRVSNHDYHFFGGWNLAYIPHVRAGTSFESVFNSFNFYLEPENGRPVTFIFGLPPQRRARR